MKVIFLDKVPGVAGPGDVKNVRNGFFRNFLQPRKKAVMATGPRLKDWEEKRKKVLIEKETLKTKIEEMKRRLSSSSIAIEKKVTAKGTLYGGVKAADICKAVLTQFSIELPEESIELKEPIKTLGKHTARLNLGEGIETDLPVEIVEKK